jgi:hypothetical protein
VLSAIVFFIVANISISATTMPGPETWLAHRPILITTLIFVQIVARLTLVAYLAGTRSPAAEAPALTAPVA